MNLGQYLKTATAKLTAVEIASARLDVLILLEDALHKDRAWLLAHPEHQLPQLLTDRIDKKLSRRARHVPLAYIRGHTEFYGRKFKINRHVLEPRPESEAMIEQLKKVAKRGAFIADVGTGCGALGITARLEITDSQVDLYDISASALAVAKHNTHLHELHLHCRKMNLLSRPLRPYDIILANLPYVPNDWHINQAAKAEPKIAIFGGFDGLDVYRKLFAQLEHFSWRASYVITEALPPQHAKLAEIALNHKFKLSITDDFIQVFKPNS